MSTCLDVSTTKPLPMIIAGIYVQFWLSKLIIGSTDEKKESAAGVSTRNECLSPTSDNQRDEVSTPTVYAEEELDQLIMNGNVIMRDKEKNPKNWKSAVCHLLLWTLRVWQCVSFIGVFALDIWSFYTFIVQNPSENGWAYYQCLALLYSNSSNLKTWMIGLISLINLSTAEISGDLYIQFMLFLYFLFGVYSIPMWITHTIPAFFVYIWIPLVGLVLFTMIFKVQSVCE